MTKILLTGAAWGDKRYTTVEAVVHYDFVGRGSHARVPGGGDVCLSDKCPWGTGQEGVEVPYLIGETVRLVGDGWAREGFPEMEGHLADVLSYDEFDEGEWLPTIAGGYGIEPGDAEPYSEAEVAQGGYTGTGNGLPVARVHPDEIYLSKESVEKISRALKANLYVDGVKVETHYHPNFIEKHAEDDEGWTAVASAYRDAYPDGEENSGWYLTPNSEGIRSQAEVDAMRAVLDEIESRMEDER